MRVVVLVVPVCEAVRRDQCSRKRQLAQLHNKVPPGPSVCRGRVAGSIRGVRVTVLAGLLSGGIFGSEAILRQLRHAGHDDSGTAARAQTGRKRDASKASTRLPCRLGQYRRGKAGRRVAVSMGGARGATMAAGYAGSETLHQIPWDGGCYWRAAQPLCFLLPTW